MKLSLGFSPCPNDTFIFNALVHHKVDTEGLEFDFRMADVEELNLRALKGELDVSKVSFHAFLFMTGQYLLLNSGSALGFGAGPLLISKKEMTLGELEGKTVAIPGRLTTANLLFSLAAPGSVLKREMIFSAIEQAVLDETVDAGVIIHENRFTYHERGLLKVADLGDFWEKLTGKPIPLGGIVAKKNLPKEILEKLDRSLRRSVEFAYTQPDLPEFVRCNAQEMSEAVMRKHIELYVNKFSVNLGTEGKEAVQILVSKAIEKGIIPEMPSGMFL